MRLKNPQRILTILCYVLIFEAIQTDTQKESSAGSTNAAKAQAGRAASSSKSGAGSCKPLDGKKGEIVQPDKNGPKKRLTKTKSDDLKDSGLPKPIITEITEILQSWSKSENAFANSSKSSSHSVIEYDTDDEQPDDKLPTPKSEPIFVKDVVVDLDANKKIYGNPECLPRLPVRPNGGRRRKRAAKKKHCRHRYRWPRHNKPICANIADKQPTGGQISPKSTSKPPDFPKVKDKVTFTVEIFEDTESEYCIRVVVSDHKKVETKTRTEDYEKDDEYLIKVRKKKPSTKPNDFTYPMYKTSNLKPEDEALLKQLAELEKLKDIDTVVTIVWTKTRNEYCASQVIFKKIEDVDSLCKDLPQYLDFLRKKDQMAKQQKTTALLTKLDSPDYKLLFGEKSQFSFTNWYQVYTRTMVPGKFGRDNFVVSEKVDTQKTGEYVRVQDIYIIWDGVEANQGKLEVKLMYPKTGDPVVDMEFYKGNGEKRVKCPVQIRRLIAPRGLKEPQKLETVAELKPKPEDESVPNDGDKDDGDDEEGTEYEIVEVHTSTSSNSSTHHTNQTTAVHTIEDNDGKPIGKVGRVAGTNLTYKGKKAKGKRNRTKSGQDKASDKN